MLLRSLESIGLISFLRLTGLAFCRLFATDPLTLAQGEPSRTSDNGVEFMHHEVNLLSLGILSTDFAQKLRDFFGFAMFETAKKEAKKDTQSMASQSLFFIKRF